MASACIHGFAPGTCLICQTLDGPNNPKNVKNPKNLKKETAVGGRQKPGALEPAPRPSRSLSPAGNRTGPRVVPKEAPRTSQPAVVKVLALAVVVIGTIVVAWTVLHIVFAVLHVIELAGVALVAGYLGWLAGVHHGRRTAHKD